MVGKPGLGQYLLGYYRCGGVLHMTDGNFHTLLHDQVIHTPETDEFRSLVTNAADSSSFSLSFFILLFLDALLLSVVLFISPVQWRFSSRDICVSDTGRRSPLPQYAYTYKRVFFFFLPQ